MAESILDPEKKRVLRLQQAVVLKGEFFLPAALDSGSDSDIDARATSTGLRRARSTWANSARR
jgi:hypothetical protein